MKNEILAYIKFDSSEEFEEWQKIEKRNLSNVIPFVSGMEIQDNQQGNYKGSTNVKVIVTYWKTIGDKPQ